MSTDPQPLTGVNRAAALAVQRAFALALLAAVAVALLRPLNSWLVFPRPVVWAAAGLGILVLVPALRYAARPGAPARPALTVWVGTVAGTLLSGAHAVLALIPFGWDARRLFTSAVTLAADAPLPTEAWVYFARYPHNVRLLALERVAIEGGAVVGLPPLAAVLLPQLLCVAVVLWASGWACLQLARPRAVVVVQALAVVLIGLSPQVAVPYTDLPAAAAVALAGAAMARCSRSWSWPWALSGAVALGLGAALKPYLVVLVIAAVLVALWSRRWQAVGLAAGLAAVTALTITVVDLGAARVTGLDADRLAALEAPFPPEHFLAMGTWDSAEDSPVRRWGAYRQDQVDATAALPEDDRRPVLRAQARQQVASRGVLGNVRFFGAKALWVWGDGTFWAQGEGADGRADSSLPAPWSAWTAATRGAGELYPLRAGVVHGIWLAVLAATATALLRARADPLLATWTLALGGLTAYLMLFEARPRYVLAFVPLLLLVLVRARLGSADPPPTNEP